jgi:Tol biopolymer transport system component
VQRGLFVSVLTGLFVAIAASPAFATFPGTNGKMAFARGGKIVSQPAGGGVDTTLATGIVTAPSYSANGNKIVYLRSSGMFGPGYFDVWKMNADGTGKKNLTNEEGRYEDPSFSPDGAWIIFDEFTGNPQGDFRLIIIRSNGLDRRAFAPDVPGTMADGVWSPNGLKIAYVGGPSGQPSRLRTINASGAEDSVKTVVPLTDASNPDWSPINHRRLVFSRATGTAVVIYRVDVDGSHLKKLADYGADRGADEPVWSPDGQWIAFDKTNWTTGANPSIWTMKPDGTSKTRVDANGYGPTWQALSPAN